MPERETTETLGGWGNYPLVQAKKHSFTTHSELLEKLQTLNQYIPRGLGRSYGDSALAPHVVSMLHYCRLISFDEETGILCCEAGTSLADILNVFVPRGWFLPVTPGTKFVTVGGAIAADVHGKNHHMAGSFSNHLVFLDLLTPDGEVRSCSLQKNPKLFQLTCGGMGLTGIILRAAVKLKPIETAYIRQTSKRYADLGAVMNAFTEKATNTYSVAWIDGLARGRNLGRSILFCGEHAKRAALNPRRALNPLNLPRKRKLSIPFNLPFNCLNPLTVRTFNFTYYRTAPTKEKTGIVDYDSFFYPLDNIGHWNRLYGKKGFTQYQFVLPLESSHEGLKQILARIARGGEGSFLSVLKLFGKQDGILNFPREGYTLAMDFPIRTNTFKLLDELDRMVLDYGGRIYLAKDARMSAACFREGYKKAEAFLEGKRSHDPHGQIQSLQSNRLGMDE